MKTSKIMCVTFLVAMLLVGCSNLPKQSPDFDQVSKEMKKIAVMPPSFQLQKVGMFSGDLVSQMNHDIEIVIKEAADTVVSVSALSSAPLDLSDQALMRRPELRTAIFEQQGALQKAQGAVSESGKTIDVEYEGNIDPFADMADCDYLAFVDGVGYFKTGGAQVTEALMAGLFGGGAGPASETFLSVLIVDANRGKVVWYNEADRQNSDPRKRSHLLNTVKELFKPLLGKSSLKWDHSRDEELIDKYKAKMKELEDADSKQ